MRHVWAVSQVEIPEKADLGAMVDDFEVRVEDDPCHGRIGEFGLLCQALRPDEPYCAEAAHAGDPCVVLMVELLQRLAAVPAQANVAT